MAPFGEDMAKPTPPENSMLKATMTIRLPTERAMAGIISATRWIWFSLV